LHLIACFWAVAATFNTSNSSNWENAIGIEDDSNVVKYITAFYWAVATTMTVGYGDIVPTNVYETGLTCVILLLGVAIFSFIQSTFANQFSSLSKSASKR
jgi:hypothetical protein